MVQRLWYNCPIDSAWTLGKVWILPKSSGAKLFSRARVFVLGICNDAYVSKYVHFRMLKFSFQLVDVFHFGLQELQNLPKPISSEDSVKSILVQELPSCVLP